MPLIRNPFRSRPNDIVGDENVKPALNESETPATKLGSWGAVTKPINIRASSSSLDIRPREYKLSEINDSGEYLPPSPTETKSSFWSTRSGTSTRSSSHLSNPNETEPFNISRESFDSYRRSFDISARSPVIDPLSQRPRQSLDARRMRHPSSFTSSPILKSVKKSAPPSSQRPARPLVNPYQQRLDTLPDDHINPPSAQPEESEDVVSQQASQENSPSSNASFSTNPTTPSDSLVDRFEDVGLGEPADASAEAKKPQPMQNAKKPSIFSRFGGSSTAMNEGSVSTVESRPGSSGHGLGLGMFGRKRGQSGQGAELGSLPGPQTGAGKKISGTNSGSQDARAES